MIRFTFKIVPHTVRFNIYIKTNLPLDQTLYASLDDLYFRQNGLVEVAEKIYEQGGRHLFLDEVHKYDDWQTAVKNIYDFLPELKLVVSGSSILVLQQSRSDLRCSRRPGVWLGE